jgi:putative ABC transport system permease protein
MARLAAQTAAVVSMNLRSLPARASLAMVTLLAVAIVVAVLLSFLAMANGFRATVAGTGSPRVAIVMREGSESEINSTITREQVNLLLEAPNVARGEAGPLGSAELYVIVDGIKRDGGTRANLPLRGIDPAGVQLREGVQVVEGRMFTPGTNEIVVGESVLREFEGFELGREVRFSRTTWTVVGVFAMRGSVFESELWADARAVQSLFQRGSTYQTMRLGLADPARFAELRDHVRNDPRLKLDARTEQEYFANQAKQTSDLIMYLGWPLGIAMAFGALAGALNTMYSSVALRAREIATLRALGFSGAAAFGGTLVESLVLSLAGGLLGALVTYVFFDGLSTTTLGGSFTQVVFRFDLSAALLWQGALLALAIGLLGGVFPAWRAAKTPVAVAFRA